MSQTDMLRKPDAPIGVRTSAAARAHGAESWLPLVKMYATAAAFNGRNHELIETNCRLGGFSDGVGQLWTSPLWRTQRMSSPTPYVSGFGETHTTMPSAVRRLTV